MLDHINIDKSVYTCIIVFYIRKYLILNMHKLSRHLTLIAYLFVVIKAIIALLGTMLTAEVVCCYNELTAILDNQRTFLTNADLVHYIQLDNEKKQTWIFHHFPFTECSALFVFFIQSTVSVENISHVD